ncbi:hypothetical protein HAV15_001676 [Penicillium sp. str. |nr:hypothetical protein HAV15_001676 [Penicillium sp. str. \
MALACAYDRMGKRLGTIGAQFVPCKTKERDIDKEGKKDNVRRVQPTCLEDRLDILVVLGREKFGRVFRKQRDRRDCWHCCRRFQKQADKPVSNKEWRYVRYWHPLLKEWICSLSRVKGRDGGCFGITISHLKDLEMRCEDCNTLYAINWTTLGQSLLDRFQDITLTRDRITCGNCYQIRHTSSLKKVKG